MMIAGDRDGARSNRRLDEARTARLSTASPVTAVASACGSILVSIFASALKRSRSFIFFQSK
jgi:hypothetical protein